MSKIHKRGPVSPEVNMTPLIDITFQLIIFFMLVNNIVRDEAITMIVPQLNNPEVIAIPEKNKVFVNLVPKNNDREKKNGQDNEYLNTDGKLALIRIGQVDLEINSSNFGDQMQKVTDLLKTWNKEAEEKGEKLEVILRADASLYYSEVMPVMQAIGLANVQQVNIVALEEGRKN